MAGPDRIWPFPARVAVRRSASYGRCLSWLSLALMALLPACDRTAEIVKTEISVAATQESEARDILAECVRTYAQLKSYEDQAYVALKYRLGGTAHSDHAPLSIAWEADGLLGLRVYSVEAGPSDGRWRLRLGNEEQGVEGQVLSRSVPKELNFDWLLSDPLVAQNLSAGLAGFPPQLDLLLSPEPLSGLLQEQAELRLDPSQEIEGRVCHVVKVTRSNATYRLFIDRANMLLRRLHLPEANLPQEMLGDRRVSDIALTIEIENIRSNLPIDWQRYRLEVNPEEALVNHFVSAPLLPETRQLGQRLPGFRLANEEGDEVYSSAEARVGKSTATVLMWLADHPACRLAAQQVAAVEQLVANDPQLKQRVHFVSIWAEADPPAGESFATLSTSWNLPGKLAFDRDAMGRDLLGVQEAPTLVILDASNRLHFRESGANPALSQLLPTLLKRLAEGEDLAASLLDEATQLRSRHQAELRIARSVDAQAVSQSSSFRPLGKGSTAEARVGDSSNTRAAPENYAPLLLTLREVSRSRHLDPMLCAAVDAQQRTWLLDANGRLTVMSAEAASSAGPKTYQTPWTPTKTSQLSVSPQADFIAMSRLPVGDSAGIPAGTQSGIEVDDLMDQVEILELQTGRNQTMHLGSDATPTDLQWLTLGGAKWPRLAVITSDCRTLLLDPRNREQLSGDCPSAPLAILPGWSKDATLDSWIVLADRSVHPMQLSAESIHNSLRTLGRPATYGKKDDSSSLQPTLQLGFWPARGPWLACSSKPSPASVNTAGRQAPVETLILARGWIAQDEPAAFLLDSNLRVRWHARMALQPEQAAPPMLSAATDPNIGMATWALADAEQTIYLMRSDGRTDHFRISDRLIGLSLFAKGERLMLQAVEPNQSVTYEVRWK